MLFCGIDFSITSPALTMYNEETGTTTFHTFQRNRTFYGLSKPHQDMFLRMEQFGVRLHLFDSENPVDDYVIRERQKLNEAVDVARRICAAIHNQNALASNTIIALEGLSLNSKGAHVYDLAGYQYVLRQNLVSGVLEWNVDNLIIVPPTQLKKFATGKGNAKKDQMINAFLSSTRATGVALRDDMVDNPDAYRTTKEYRKPIDDIVDSFYLCCYARNNVRGE